MMEGRVAVIAGATGGLGQVVAKRLAGGGARLALIGTDQERLDTLVGELGLPQDRVLTCVADLRGHKGAAAAARVVEERFGRAEIVVNLVGGWTGGKRVEQVSPEEVAEMLGQHLWTTFHLAQAFIPQMTAGGWGRIVAVTSPHATSPGREVSPYAIGKAAQEALVLAVAREAAGSGVTANVLQVRAIDVKHERDRSAGSKNASWTTPEEIAAAIAYLCSDEAGSVNGARIPLYGGL